jgi:glucose/arabinose dehydrogenase
LIKIKTPTLIVFSILYIAQIILLLNIITSNNSSYAEISNIKKPTNTTILYGCEKAPRTIHCDPYPNSLKGYEVIGNSSIVYNVTRDPTYVEGKDSFKAIEMLDKNREFVEIQNNIELSPSSFSISFWIKKTEDTSPYGYVLSHVNKKHTRGWLFDVSTHPTNSNTEPKQFLNFVIVNSEKNKTKTNSIPINSSAFTHVVGTFNGSTVKIYKDGGLIDTKAFKGNYNKDPDLPIHIGSASYCSSCNRWSGVIDDLLFYNRTLTENEIEQIFTSNQTTDFPSGITGQWLFDNNLHDTSGNNNHGHMFTPLGSMAFAPDGRLFFTEKNTGFVRIMKDDIVYKEPFAKISDSFVNWEQGLLGIAIDPKFEENHYVYVYYTAVKNKNGDQDGEPFNRVVRFTEKNNTATNMVYLIDNILASRGFHAGGALAFGPDDKLYITVGDATEHEFALDPSISIGKVLRINRDGTIPQDNPFPDSPIYTMGHRNMYGIAFDQDRQFGIVTENGDYYYDEINVIEKGGNYGFPFNQPPNTLPLLSNSSISPLRSYWATIAPTQAIYYTEDKYHSLKNNFLFGAYNGNIYSLNVTEQNGKYQLVDEKRISLELFPFEPLIGIGNSPNGNIYFGAYHIYRLDNLNLDEKRISVFPIEITNSNDIKIDNVRVKDLKSHNQISIDMHILNSSSSSSSSSSFINLKIPQEVIYDILDMDAIEVKHDTKSMQDIVFTVDKSSLDSTNIFIPLSSNNYTSLILNGTKIPSSQLQIKEKTLSTITTMKNQSLPYNITYDMYDDFDNNTYTLLDGQISPNEKWRNIYNGGGESGVRKDNKNNNNNVFFMKPNITKSSNETYATFVKSTNEYTDFKMKIDVKTGKQLRELNNNNIANPWEAAWIFFRYTDDFHYYWFVLKPTGIELGKKDCDTCKNSYEGQIFLLTKEQPILKIDDWSTWEISMIGNHIIISIDGKVVMDLKDPSMSKNLTNGSIGLYTEDAAVSFDNVYINPVLPK